MASEVFIDTSAYYALLDRNDQWHDAAKAAIVRIEKEGLRAVTTDDVLDETVTLLQSRGLSYVASPWLDGFFEDASSDVVWMNSNRFDEVRRLFAKHHDKEWSFTDCFSFCVMRERKIRQAFSTDLHFQQAGFERLLS